MLKRKNIVFLCHCLALALLLSSASMTLVVPPQVAHASGTAYYINNQTGSSCSNAGPGTSTAAPWCDFAPVNAKTFQPGDQILLARGAVWNQEMHLNGSGTAADYITVDAYGTGSKPKIDRNRDVNDRTILMNNPSYWNVRNLEISNAAQGIEVILTQLGNQGLIFSNLYIHDVDLMTKASPANDIGVYNSTAIIFYGNNCESPGAAEWYLKDVEISHVKTFKTDPVSFSGGCTSSPNTTFQHITIKNNDFDIIPGVLAFYHSSNVNIVANRINTCATRFQSQGTTCIFLWDTRDVTIANNTITHVPDTFTTDMSAVDVEAYNDQVRLRGNYIAGAAGSGYEFLHLPQNPGDYSINHEVSGNVFSGNNTSGNTTYKSSLSDLNLNSSPFTGTAADNLYYEPSGFLNDAGAFSDWTLTNNKPIASAQNLYNAGYGFGETQETGGWSYQLYDGSSYANLTYDSANEWWGNSSGYVSRFNQLPNGSSGSWVARVWTAPTGGMISIRGRVLKNDIDGGDGVAARITKNGNVIWPASGIPQTIAYDEMSGYDTNLDSIPVTTGDVIRFEVNNGGDANSTSDLTSWAPSIAYSDGSCVAGTNLALCKSYSASSEWDASQTAEKAFDGTTNTNWQAGSSYPGQWLEVDFGTPTTFNKAVLSEYGSRTTGFRIEYWNGTAWATACTGTAIGSPTAPGTLAFAPVTGSKARIYYTSGTLTPILYEFEIYNQAVGDTTAPAAITKFAVNSTTAGTAVLGWTAPGDDGTTGTAADYDIRYSTALITEANWASATQASGEPAPAAAGTSQSFTVSGLSPNTAYYFAIKTSDEAPNESELSTVPSGKTKVYPNLASNQTYSASSSYNASQSPDKAFDGSLSTIWQASATFVGQWLEVDFGADTTFNKVVLSEYGSRTSGFRIEYWNGTAWTTAYTGTAIGSPTAPSTHTFAAVTGTKARIYYTSGTATPSIYEFEIYYSGLDTTAPSNVTDLAVSTILSCTAILSWTAPGDDGTTGTAAGYDIRYSSAPITDANWASATQAAGEPAPAAAGTSQSFTIGRLDPNTAYYFAVKTADEEPNESGLSNMASGTTPVAPNNPTYLLNYDFNGMTTGGAPAGYTTVTTGGTVTVENMPSALDKSLKVSKSGTTNDALVSKTFAAASGTVTVEARVRSQETAEWKNALYVYDNSGNPAVSIVFSLGSFSIWDGVTATPVQAFAADTWYDLKVVLDTDTDKFDLYVDGVLKSSQVGFRTATTNVAKMLFGIASNESGTLYVDNVKAYL